MGDHVEMEDEPWPPGSIARLVKLQSAPALNMQRATILSYDEATDRYEVRLHWDGSVKRVREENLYVEEVAAAAPAASPARDMDPDGMPAAETPRANHAVPDEVDVEASPRVELAFEVDEVSDVEEDPTSTIPIIKADGGETSPVKPSKCGASPSPVPSPAAATQGQGSEAVPEVRRRKRRLDSTSTRGNGDGAGATGAPASSLSSPWVVRAGPDRPAEDAQPQGSSQQPEPNQVKRPAKLRVGYRGKQPDSGSTGRMAAGLRALYWSGELCDIALVCGETSLRAHRAVLAGQSEVLRDLVRDKAEVPLPEISHPEAARLMLDYLYEIGDESSYAPALPDINRDVLHLADRFQLPELKRRAAVFLAKGVTGENAVERLQICEDFQLHDLRGRILDQLATNKKALAQVSGSPAVAKHPQLLQEILQRVAGPGTPGR